MIKKYYKIFLLCIVFGSLPQANSDDFLDFPLSYIVDSCRITKQRFSPETESQADILKGRNQYKTCMNFIMSLSTTLNQRCLTMKEKKLSPESSMTYADLSNVKSTYELIDEIILYSERFPHFNNQIAWLHASKAISQKWPCY